VKRLRTSNARPSTADVSMPAAIGATALAIRDYTPDDRSACLALFDGNAPASFAFEERADYARFLDRPPCKYLVVEAEQAGVVAAGGYYVTERPGLGGLAWGIVERRWQRRGVGTLLLETRLACLRALGVTQSRVRTSGMSRGFFERAGFRPAQRAGNPSPPSAELIELVLDLH